MATSSAGPEDPPQSDHTQPASGIERVVDGVESSVLVALLLTLIGLGLAQIILRNLFGTALPWADGAMRAIVLWLAMLSAAMAAGHLKHIRIDVLERLLPPSVQRWVARLMLLSTGAICLSMAWLSLRMVALEFEFRTQAFLNVPNWVVVLIVPIGFALMAARFLAHALLPPTPTRPDTAPETPS